VVTLRKQNRAETIHLFRSGFWLTSRYLILSISGLIISVAFARLSALETYGKYQFVLSLLAMVSFFSLPGLNMAAMKSAARGEASSVLEAVRWSFKFSLVATPFLLGYGVFLLHGSQNQLGISIILASFLFPFFYAPNTWHVFYESRLNFKPVTIRITIATIMVTMAVLFGLYLKLNFLWLILIYLSLSSIFSGVFYLEVRKKVLNISMADSTDGLDIGYGLKVSVQKFVYTLSETIPPLAISFILGHSVLARFQVANIFLGGISGLIGALAVISLPRLFTESESSHRTIFWQNVVTGLIAAIGYWFIVQILFFPLYGPNYRESLTLAQLFVGLPLLISPRTFLVNYFTARDKNILIIVVYIVANSVSLACFIVAAQTYSFITASCVYLYTLNVLLFIPLVTAYFLNATSITPKLMEYKINPHNKKRNKDHNR
jgi:O-antigen/teichoic acid export membrane protein